MPPKLTREGILDKLVDLRAYVANHADVMRLRRGASVLEKLRQTASPEEKRWHNFLAYTATSFTTSHEEHLASTYVLISETAAPSGSGASTDANAESQISNHRSRPRSFEHRCGASG